VTDSALTSVVVSVEMVVVDKFEICWFDSDVMNDAI
jgi:hypothetical protein